MHRKFDQFCGEYKDVSDEVKAKLESTEMDWLFFKDSETHKIVAGNVDKTSQTTRFGWTALHRVAVCTDDQFEIARALIEAGVNVNARNSDFRTALHEFARYNDDDDAKLARALIEAGAYVNARDNEGRTALHFAASGRHLEIGKCLLEAGAKLDLRTKYNDTALDLAEGHDDFVAMLRAYQK